jgi:hypothetical protein
MKPRLVGLRASCLSNSPHRVQLLVDAAERAGFGGLCLSDSLSRCFDDESVVASLSCLKPAAEASRVHIGLLGECSADWCAPQVAAELQALSGAAKNRFWVAVRCDLFGSSTSVETTRSDRKEIRDDVETLRIRCSRTAPEVYAEASTAEDAAWAGTWADGLFISKFEVRALRRIIDAFDESGGAGKPTALMLSFAVAAREFQSLHGASLGATGGRHQCEATIQRGSVHLAVDWQEIYQWIDESFEAGIDAVYLDPVGVDLARFFSECGEHLLPQLTGFRRAA